MKQAYLAVVVATILGIGFGAAVCHKPQKCECSDKCKCEKSNCLCATLRSPKPCCKKPCCKKAVCQCIYSDTDKLLPDGCICELCKCEREKK